MSIVICMLGIYLLFFYFYISTPVNLSFVDNSEHIMIIWPEMWSALHNAPQCYE